MSWQTSLCSSAPLETSCTSLLCPMILFGHNNAKLRAIEGDPYPSWVPYCFGYAGSYLLGNVCFIGYVPLLVALASNATLTPYAIQTGANLCGSLSIGLYAGTFRTKLREKYNIEGSKCHDVAVHTFISPCALCQEAQEIDAHVLENNGTTTDVIYTPILPHEEFSK